MKKNNEQKEVLSFREKMKDKKYSAKIQLLGYGIFIGIIIIYANVSTKNYDYNYSNQITNTTTDITETNQTNTEKSLLETIDTNYEYNTQVEIINDKDEITNYQYSGFSNKDILKIITNNKSYYLKNNEYYEETEENYKVTEVGTIYGKLEYKYIDLKEILNYIEKSSLDHTTNYSNGQTISTYYLYLKNILPNYHEDNYIEISTKEIDNNLYIDIDYTNLINYQNKEIKSYKVSLIYSNINKVEKVTIEIPTSHEE